MKKIFTRIFIGLVLSTSSWASPIIRGSGEPPRPTQVSAPYACKITWIADGSIAGISQANFILDPDMLAVNAQDLKWKHGYTNSLSPLQNLSEENGRGEAKKKNGKRIPLLYPIAYIAKLNLHYDISNELPLNIEDRT